MDHTQVVTSSCCCSRRLGVPYPILLVIGGSLVGVVPGTPGFELDSDLVLYVLLPPLPFVAAYSSSAGLPDDVRRLGHTGRPGAHTAAGHPRPRRPRRRGPGARGTPRRQGGHACGLEEIGRLAAEDWTREDTMERMRGMYEFRQRRLLQRAGRSEVGDEDALHVVERELDLEEERLDS